MFFGGVCGEKCPPSRVNLSTTFHEKKSELPTFKDFIERKNSESQNIAKIKADNNINTLFKERVYKEQAVLENPRLSL